MAGKYETLDRALQIAPEAVQDFVDKARAKLGNSDDCFEAAVTRVLMCGSEPRAVYSLAFTTVDGESTAYITEAYSEAGEPAVRWGLAEASEVVRRMGFSRLYFRAERRGWLRRAAHYGFQQTAHGEFSYYKEV